MTHHDEPKRIAFLGRGGHTLPTYRALLNELSKVFDMTLYSEVPVMPEWLALPHSYRIRSVPSGRIWRRLTEFYFLGLLIFDHLKRPFDLVQAHSTYPTGFAAVILQKTFKVPAIVSLHAAEGSAFPEIKFGDLLHRKRRIMNRWVINNAKAVTVLSEFQAGEIRKNLDVKRDLLVLPRGVDLNQFFFRKSDGLRSPLLFLSVGYLNPIKDPETLIRSFFLIQEQVDARLIIIGKDYMEGAIQAMVKDMGISQKVKFEGFIDHSRLHEHYRQADILLHTSLYESQGMVVAEAMASGVLVCGTRVGLMSDLSGACCITAAPGDPEAMAQAILALLQNKEQVRALRERAYAWSKSNSLERTCEKLIAIYRHTGV